MRLIQPLLLLVLLAAFSVHGDVVADENEAKPEDAPREFTEEELKLANDLRLTLTTDQQTLYNGLRFLMRPEFETELMQGRRHRTSTLTPFEEKSDEPLTLLECLRLWAVLQSGMRATPAMDRQVQRFIDTPAPRSSINLAHLGVMIMLARSAWAHPTIGRVDELKLKAEALLRAGDELTDATSARSPLIAKQIVRPMWFANHLWRALMMRAGLELELEIDTRLWESDLKALADAHRKEVAWSGLPEPAFNLANDLHPNLMALCAIGLASELPDKTLRQAGVRAVEKMTEQAAGTIDRLDREYGDEPWYGARLLVALSMPSAFSPERESAETWRARLLRGGVAKIEPAGFVMASDTMARELGLHQATWTRAEGADCETALTCLAVSGGLYPSSAGPMAGRELGSVGRLFHAFAVLHAHKARTSSGNDFDSSVNIAIEDGCDHLARIQNDDGSFPGQHSRSPGNTALCLLAMMHGGWATEHEAIKRGINWLLDPANRRSAGTYDAACILMCLQKYHEPLQRKAGILFVNSPEEFEDARREVWKGLDKSHRETISKLVDELDAARVDGNKGGWGYRPPVAGQRDPHSDNSISQYAMLGYKAASLLGAELGIAVFMDEAERLIRQYTPDENAEVVEYEHVEDDREGDEGKRERKTSDRHTESIAPGGWSYRCGSHGYNLQMTAAGISSLTVCMDELKVRGKLKKLLAQKIGLTIRGAEAYVHAQYYKADEFSGARNPLARAGSDGWGGFYNLYSVERACVMAGIRKLEGETDWYRIGADGLIDNQHLDGSWGVERVVQAGSSGDTRQVVNTCLAILFLKQASMPVITEHKKREKEREERENETKPKDPITGK